MKKSPDSDWARFWRDPTISALEMRFSSYDNLIFPKHTHDSYAIGLVEKGNSVFYYRGVNHPISAGQIALIPPGCTVSLIGAWLLLDERLSALQGIGGAVARRGLPG